MGEETSQVYVTEDNMLVINREKLSCDQLVGICKQVGDIVKCKCRFYNSCPLRQIGSYCCEDNDKAKNYYGVGSPAGCYRKMAKLEKEWKH